MWIMQDLISGGSVWWWGHHGLMEGSCIKDGEEGKPPPGIWFLGRVNVDEEEALCKISH